MNDSQERVYQIRQIKGVREIPDEYMVDNVRCNIVNNCVNYDLQLLVLTYEDDEKEFDLNSISNSKLSENDYSNFIEEQEHYGKTIMTKNVPIFVQ